MVRSVAVLFLVVFSAVVQPAWAHLVFWKPDGRSVTFVLPENTTPEKFLANVRNYPSLGSYVESLRVSQQDSILSSAGSSSAVGATLLVANKIQDHERLHPRVDNFARHFQSVFVLPVGASLRLSPSEEQKFYRDLGDYFGLVIFMGGDDKHPGLAGEKITWSVNLNRLRDQLEQKLIRGLYYQTSTRLFGVCRGLQQIFTSLGGKLNQDLTQDLHIEEEHQNGARHKIIFSQTTHGILQKFLSGTSQIFVNSYHHQSAREVSVTGSIFEIAARSPEGVIEALESRDGRVALVQFHPEMSDNSEGYSSLFFRNVQQWAEKSARHSCQKLF